LTAENVKAVYKKKTGPVKAPIIGLTGEKKIEAFKIRDEDKIIRPCICIGNGADHCVRFS